MAYDFDKLRGRITEVFKTQGNFSKAMGWSERTCSLKINCKIDWKQDEIISACKLLKLQQEDIPRYFFKLKVQ